MSSKLIAIPVALLSLTAIVLGFGQIRAGFSEILGSPVPTASHVRSIAMDARTDMTTFVHEGSGITLSYPRLWTSFDDQVEPILLTFQAQRGVINYSVLSEEVDAGTSLAPLVQDNIDELQAGGALDLPSVDVHGQRDLEVGGAPATEIRMRVDVPNVPFEVTVHQTYVLSGERAYVITLTAPTSVIDELDGLTNDILGSIEFL